MSGDRKPGSVKLREFQAIPVSELGTVVAPDTQVTWRPCRLSSNENPYPPLPEVLRLIEQEARHVNRYPDMSASALSNELAAHYDVPVTHIATGPGSIGVAQQLLHATSGPGDEVIYAWRTFDGYPIITQVSAAVSVRVPLTGGAVHDLDAMAAAVTERTRLIIVCNPNNPTGTVVHRAELERFLDRVPSDVVVVIDEAYREFVRDADVPDGIEFYRNRPNVVLLRTFSKAYGLAGLRIGFAIAHEPVAAALRATAVPFGVNSLAQAAAVASLRAEADLLERVDALVRERSRVYEGLRAAGWTAPASEGNFLWLPLGELTAEFAAKCRQAGLQVCVYAGDGVRVTIGETSANDILLRVAAELRPRGVTQ